MEAFLAKQNIIIVAEEGIGTLTFPGEIPDEFKLPPILVGKKPEELHDKDIHDGEASFAVLSVVVRLIPYRTINAKNPRQAGVRRGVNLP